MSSSFQKKSSQIFLTVFIGIIVISFMFSGPFFGTGTPDSVGSVGPHDIKVREFNAEVQRQSGFYSQFFKGGQPLTSNELKQYRVYDNAIKNLVFQKLALILADDTGMVVGEEAIKDDIKNATYFKTNDKFDINKYKALLSYNKITPEDFEKETEGRLMSQRLQQLMAVIPYSKDFKETLNKLYKDKRETKIVTLNHADLRKTITISNKEVKEFLAKENNKKKVESIFKERKAALDQQEEVKTRHILIKDSKDALAKAKKIRKEVKKSNFITLAKKYTDEPQGKANGGDLNWVKRGQMVPEFEKAVFSMKPGQISDPVKTNFGYHIIFVEKRKEAKEAKLAEFESTLAKEMIQKERDIKPLIESAQKEIMAALESKKSLKSLESKYKILVKDKIVINRLEGSGQGGDLSETAVEDIFGKNKMLGMEKKEVKTVFYAATNFTGQNNVDFDLKPITNIMTQQTRKAMLDNLSKSYSFKQNKYARLPN